MDIPMRGLRSARRPVLDVAETDPDSSTTGTWSKPFSRRISMVCLQVTVGSTVSGVDRLSSWTWRCHHLRGEGRAGRAEGRQVGVKDKHHAGRAGMTSQAWDRHRHPGPRDLVRSPCGSGGACSEVSSPGLLHREALLLQEALLQHPPVTQELGPAGDGRSAGPGGGSHHRLCPHQGAQFPQKPRTPPRPHRSRGSPRGWLELQEEAWEPDCREPVGI